jgi:hypothetical protein
LQFFLNSEILEMQHKSETFDSLEASSTRLTFDWLIVLQGKEGREDSGPLVGIGCRDPSSDLPTSCNRDFEFEGGNS